MGKELTGREELRLSECETVIQSGLSTFMEVGKALWEIKESKLYRLTHSSFAAYCASRWKLDKRRADRMVGGFLATERVAQNGVNLPQIIPSLTPPKESHAAELAKLPQGEQAEVWQQALETAPQKADGTPKVTAKHVREIVEKKREDLKADGPEPEVPKTRAEKAIDERYRFAEIQAEIQRVRQAVKALAETPIGKFVRLQEIDTDLKNAWRALKFAAPYAECCYCAGKGCKACNRGGWLPKGIYDQAPPEMKP